MEKEIRLEYYVLNSDFNGKKIVNFNIFNNWPLNDAVVKEIRRYLRGPSKYTYDQWLSGGETLHGWDAFKERILRLIAWQERGRCEYEIAVGDLFIKEVGDVLRDIDKFDNLEDFKEHLEKVSNRNSRLEKWDCYDQCAPNIEAICRDIIRQYKEQTKKGL